MGFVEGHIEGEKIFKGKVFPLTLLPPESVGKEPGASDLVAMVRAERERLAEILEQHSAILFRGFNVSSPEEFSRVAQAFEWEEFQYKGAADRVKLAERVYTTNAVPLDVEINFHHEMAMIKDFPRRIMFFCMQPASAGGETSIIPSNVIVEKMEEQMPEVIAKLAQDGILLVLHTKIAFENNMPTVDPTRGTPIWHKMLKTTDQVEAEKRAKEMLACNSVKFNDDGSADFIFGPMNPIREFNGKRVMFQRILGYENDERDTFISFGDGKPLPLSCSQVIQKIYEDNCVDLPWEKGDVAVVDNLAVQHARRPGKPPRVVLVSLSN